MNSLYPTVLGGFALALSASLVATPAVMLLAHRLGVLDRPSAERTYKHHKVPIPYLGGLAVFYAATAISLTAGDAWRGLIGVVVGAACLGLVGLADDLLEVGLVFRLLAQSLAAVLAIGAGISASATGIPALDLIVTFVWLVGITNAINVIDNCNGITAGTLAISGGAIAVLAVSAEQSLVSLLAASISGASLGFLPFNFPKARVFLGDAGTLPLGFLIAVLGLKLDVEIQPPLGFAVPLCVLAVPILNTLLVSVHRIRIGQPIWVGGQDSAWHRLVILGLSPTGAVGVLLALQALLAVVGVLAGTRVFSPLSMPVALGAALLAFIALLFVEVPKLSDAVTTESQEDNASNLGPSRQSS